MCNTAAHVVDRVLPAVPVRQWVLALPLELRRLAAFRAGVATAIGRIFIQEIAKAQKRRAGVPGAQHGALNFIQRFGGSLNLNLHFHAIVLEGVFAANRSGRQAFREIGAPSHEELEDIVQRIRERTLCWLRKCGLLDERPNEERSNEAPERSALDACAEVALRGGELVRIEDETVVPPDDGGEARFEAKRRGPLTVELDGFNVEAAVRIEGYDDEGRERLVRYCAAGEAGAEGAGERHGDAVAQRRRAKRGGAVGSAGARRSGRGGWGAADDGAWRGRARAGVDCAGRCTAVG